MVNIVAGKELLSKKGILRRLYDRAIKFVTWVLDKLSDRLNIVLFVIVVIVLYSPCWLCMLLYAITGGNALLAVSTGYMAFWAGPFTPFFPLCLAITFAIRKLINKLIKKRD